ncbi:hypothetical protein M0805_001343 [Coniferiporia weirii]|nr:hypothetical protein M0805_001343 [Coniferiporia weirii]
MSHYTGHNTANFKPSSRVAFIGGGLLATSLLGFFYFLDSRHNRKRALDTADDAAGNNHPGGRISSWETRMLQRATPKSTSFPTTVRSTSVETIGGHPRAIATIHDAHHRTLAEESAATGDGSEGRNFAVPTPQRAGTEGRVYTKSPDWHDAAHAGSVGTVSSGMAGEMPKLTGEDTSAGEGAKDDTSWTAAGEVGRVASGAQSEAQGIADKIKGMFSGK